MTPTLPRVAARTIRAATLDDVPRLVTLARDQIAAVYGDAIADSPGQLAITITQLITGAASVVFVAERAETVIGMAGYVRFPHHASGLPTAGQIMWWVAPEARGCGLALLKRAERWAAETGAVQVQACAPALNARVGRLYERRGYRAVETSYQAVVTPAMTALTVVDDVLEDFPAYAAATRAQDVRTVEPSPGVVFHGIADAVTDELPRWLAARYPTLTPTLTLVRRSPFGQPEPTFIHTDVDMGDWSAIYYLTAQPADGDGTTFWRWRETGAIRSLATTADEQRAEWRAWPDLPQWEPWTLVAAVPNRLVLFPSCYFHSRALVAHYGQGDTARLVQLVFGTGTFPPEGV